MIGPTLHASICVGCGLCCDGTILSHLAVSDQSDLGVPLQLLGVQILVEADPLVFALPCPAVRDGVCTIYEKHRPHACAQFSCALLDAVNDGIVDTGRAREVIRATITARDGVRDGSVDRSTLEALVAEHFRAPND